MALSEQSYCGRLDSQPDLQGHFYLLTPVFVQHPHLPVHVKNITSKQQVRHDFDLQISSL